VGSRKEGKGSDGDKEEEEEEEEEEELAALRHTNDTLNAALRALQARADAQVGGADGRGMEMCGRTCAY
jgi:hypothetical protein